MADIKNNYVAVDYELYTPNEKGNWDLVEKTSKDHPFMFITGMGFSLDAFEKNIEGLKAGDTFDFTIPVDEAYGPFVEERVLELSKDIFCINGKFDDERIYPGNVIPLANADGNHFEGLVREVRENVVIIDLNHPLADKELHFKGTIVDMHPATTHEIEQFVKMMNGEEDCNGCCGGEGGCCGHHGENGACGNEEKHKGGCCHGGGCCGH